jgi:hypothetical protein
MNKLLIMCCLLATDASVDGLKQQKVIDPQKCTSIGVGSKGMADGST